MSLTSDMGVSVLDRFYWKPETYNEHRITVLFDHLIKGYYGAEGLKSYYSFDNSIGYEEYVDFEDTRNVLYLGSFDIFLEISAHYLLKGNLVFFNSDEYEKQSIHLSLLYRW